MRTRNEVILVGLVVIGFVIAAAIELNWAKIPIPHRHLTNLDHFPYPAPNE